VALASSSLHRTDVAVCPICSMRPYGATLCRMRRGASQGFAARIRITLEQG
jgi:hypothetical protein